MLKKYLDGNKKVSAASLQFEAACDDVDLGSAREISAALRDLGWTKYRNHKGVRWIAPGETPVTAGAMAVKNGVLAIARMVRAIDGDAVDSKTFSEMCRAALGLGLGDDMPGNLMSKIATDMMPKLGWELDKTNKTNGYPTWRRKEETI